MKVWIHEDELYPDYEIYIDPGHYTIEIELTRELIGTYVRARNDYLQMRDLIEDAILKRGRKIGAVPGLTPEAVRNGTMQHRKYE